MMYVVYSMSAAAHTSSDIFLRFIPEVQGFYYISVQLRQCCKLFICHAFAFLVGVWFQFLIAHKTAFTVFMASLTVSRPVSVSML